MSEQRKDSTQAVVPAAPADTALITDYRERHDGWTPLRQRAFLRALSETGCVRDACARAQISNTSAYRMRRRAPAFAHAWDRALARAVPTLEQAAYERAVIGWEEPVFHAGKVVGTRRRYSDALLRALLQRGDRLAEQVTGAGKTPGELIAAAQQAARAAGGSFSTPAQDEDVMIALERKLDAVARRIEREAADAGEWLPGPDSNQRPIG